MSSKIDPSLLYENRPNRTPKTGESNLGKDEFLKILIAQLQHQDPLNPMDDREFIAQMAQFSSLEQMMNMSKTLESFVASQQDGRMVQYTHLIGKQVEWLKPSDEEGGKPSVETNTVVAVRQHEGKVLLKLDNDEWIDPIIVQQVSQPKVNNEESTEEKPNEIDSEE